MPSKISLPLLLIVATLLAGGCAKQEPAAPAAAVPEPATAPAPAVATGPRVLNIASLDTMKYTIDRLEASPGESVTLVLVNQGTQPKAVMGHNWVLLKAGVDVNTFAAACLVAGPSRDYLATERSADIIAHTRMLGPKEKDEVTFTAPTAPGEYVFLCTFPAHLQIGMKGVLVVK